MTPNADKIKGDIVEWIANGGTLTSFLRSRPGLPAYSTVAVWQIEDVAFSGEVARARDSGADVIADEAFEFMDAKPERGSDGKIDPAWVQLQRARVDSRLKLLACWSPKKYGQKTETALTGADGAPLSLSVQFVRPGGGDAP